MVIRYGKRALPLLVLGVLAGCGGNGDNAMVLANTHTVFGESQAINGSMAQTYAVTTSGVVTEVGVSVPYSVVINPPASAGSGPAGSFIDIAYPSVAQQSTFFNHFEMHWEPNGHPPAVFQVPHFDIHAFGIPISSVAAITSPDPQAPDSDHLAPGYVYPGTAQCVPQMGTHAVNPNDLNTTFTKVMILGYYNGSEIFVEPMVTQAQLETKQNFDLPIAVPNVLGRTTMYPTMFHAVYDANQDVYRFSFTDFVQKQ